MNSKCDRALFARPTNDMRPMYYFSLPAPGSDDTEQVILDEINRCQRCGCGTLIPQYVAGTELCSDDIEALRETYAFLLREAKAASLHVGLYLDPAFEHAIIRTMGEVGDNTLRAKLLECREYACGRLENVNRKLQSDSPLSVVAFDEESCEIVDMRPFITEGRIKWQAPQGNWLLRQYILVEDTEREGANYLSYDASYGYIQSVFTILGDAIRPYLGNTLSVLSYSGIGFNGHNRRSWDASFNEAFEARFGFDPAPFYPALFGYIGKETAHMKALFMTVRASLLQNGIMRALHDFAAAHGLVTFGNLSEPKLSACSWLMGDAMLNNGYSPCAVFDKAYMYGTNSVKIAAGAAYNFDLPEVNVELFRNYRMHDPGRLYRDAMNAMARGANCTALHLPPALCNDSSFCDFIARVQSLLHGGRHVADIAMLYPIYHLHSKVNMYTAPADGYEYPYTPSTADYMSLINTISTYAGHDLTLLHPETLSARCHTEGGVLYLDNQSNREQFRLLVLPATDMISLENLRMLKKFFDEGGKLLATGALPTMAFEYDENGENDLEVQRLTAEIFGEEACNKHIMRDYCLNKNAAGGEALFLYFNRSAADGTMMTESSTVNEAINSFGLAFDVYLPAMPRFGTTGALNCIFPEFKTIGLDRTIPGGGMLNYIHKRYDDCEIYYFSNTTTTPYHHRVMLRGALDVDIWDPHTGAILPSPETLISYKGEVYTDLRLDLPVRHSTFFVGRPVSTEGKKIKTISSIEALRTHHAELMSEF